MKDRLVAAGIAILIPLVLGAAPVARGATNEVSYDFFFNSMPESGSWRESADLGFVWQPRIAATKPDWRPYTDGYWSQTDQGWTWVSNEDFGWATYHYG